MTNMTNNLMPQATPNFNHVTVPQALSTYQKTSGTSSSSGYVDPFGDVAYQEWVASLGLAQQQQANIEPKTIWPGAVTRSSSRIAGHDVSTSGFPDYITSTLHEAVGSDAGGMFNIGMDEDGIVNNLKVPTNTPITANDGGADETGLSNYPNSAPSITNDASFPAQNSYDFPAPAISDELAHSLTHSLLNQPHPLHIATQYAQPQQIPLPAAEVRSRKENRHLNTASSTQCTSSNASPSVEAQIRKFSQTSNAFGVIGHDRDSSGIGPTSSRRTSAGDFGVNITNQAPTPGPTYAGAAASVTASSSGSEKGTKRARSFTPAGTKANDEEDDSRRVSPRVRAATVVSDDEEGQGQGLK